MEEAPLYGPPPACTTPGTTSPAFPCYLVSKGNPKQFGAVSLLSEVKFELESPSFRGQSKALASVPCW